MDAVSIRVPYRNLKEAELELEMGHLNGDPSGEIHDLGSRPSGGLPPSFPSASSSSPDEYGSSDASHRSQPRSSMKTLVLSCIVAAGVQFGWALQLSLLTPYIQVIWLFDLSLPFCLILGSIINFLKFQCGITMQL